MTRFEVPGGVLELACEDITQATTDAIGNAANAMLAGGGGVDGAIHRAAGPELSEALSVIKRGLPGGLLATGQAVITPGFRLRARHVIHCVGPIYDREGADAPALLASCYAEAVRLCREHHLASVTFPSISTGVFGYPLDEAAPIALRAIAEASREPGGPTLYRMALFGEETLDAYLEAARVLTAGR
jgi:O-acetyl-ADP-ribose deacetylase (regulator of RNase III)